MYIKRIRVKNFKSFATLDLNLNNLNIFIGANASGKSNLIGIFKFLRNIVKYGLEDAISIEGGVEYLRNIVLGPSENLEIVIEYALPSTHVANADQTSTTIQEGEYKFTLRFHKRQQNFKVIRDELTLFYHLGDEADNQPIRTKAFSLKVNTKKRIKAKIYLNDDKIDPLLRQTFLMISSLNDTVITQKALFLETPYFLIANGLYQVFSSLAIYDLYPKISKQASVIVGLKELNEDGSNLSAILNDIARNEEQKRKFLNLLNNLLPFVSNFKVQQFADKSILFQINEKYSSDNDYLPASLISDGTASIIALIVGLYFEQKMQIILEEPERYIHPSLISKLVNMFEDASTNRQLFVTTHNPEIVRYADLNNLFLVSRDMQGFSTVQKPVEIETVKIFLQNEIGIEELYVQNLIEAPQ